MKYLKVFTDFRYAVNTLGEAERGRLFSAMLEYAETGDAPELRGNEKALFMVAKIQIDSQRASYEHQCEVNRDNINARHNGLRIDTSRNESYGVVTSRNESKQDQDQDQDKDQDKRKINREKAAAFVRPTEADIVEYCKEAGITVNAQAFLDYYDSNGWKVGSSKMKDWKATARGWARRDAERKQGSKKGMGANAPYKQTMLTDDELDALLVDLDHDMEGVT